MAVAGGMKVVKYVLFGFNLVFFIAGLIMIIGGSVIQAKLNSYWDFFSGSVNAAAILLIVVGVVVFVISFFGCRGADKENHCMVMTFAALLGVVFILEISAGIAAYALRGQIDNGPIGEYIDQNLVKTMEQYTDAEGVAKSWDRMQQDLHCCGVRTPTDWHNTTAATPYSINGTFPDSCCKTETANCGATESAASMFHEGCLPALGDWVKGHVVVVGGLGIGLAFIQVFGIVLACALARTIKKEEYDGVKTGGEE